MATDAEGGMRRINCELRIFNFAICNEVAIRSRVAGFQGRSTRCAAHPITVIRCALGGNRRLLSPRSSFGGLAAVCETCMGSACVHGQSILSNMLAATQVINAHA